MTVKELLEEECLLTHGVFKSIEKLMIFYSKKLNELHDKGKERTPDEEIFFHAVLCRSGMVSMWFAGAEHVMRSHEAEHAALQLQERLKTFHQQLKSKEN